MRSIRRGIHPQNLGSEPLPTYLQETPHGTVAWVPCVPTTGATQDKGAAPAQTAPILSTIILAQGIAPTAPPAPKTPQTPQAGQTPERQPSTDSNNQQQNNQDNQNNQQNDQNNQNNQDNQQNNDNFSQGAEAGSSLASSAAPNVMGDLLNAFRSTSFFVNRAAGNVLVQGLGSTNVFNAKVADNNSPLPQDRVYYRHNYFHNAVSVTGISNTEIMAPGALGTQNLRQTKFYGVDLHTLGFEKSFFHDLMSVELRVPFQTTVSSTLNFSYGAVVGQDVARFRPSGVPVPGTASMPVDLVQFNKLFSTQQFFAGDVGYGGKAFVVSPTPGMTLGNEATEMGDLQLIFKYILHQNCKFALSCGLSVSIPTAQDERVTVIDYFGDARLQYPNFQRVRNFYIKNENWGLSPFFAFLAKPTDRFFVQGFVEADFPTNGDPVVFTQSSVFPGQPDPSNLPNFSNQSNPPGFRNETFSEYQQQLSNMQKGLLPLNYVPGIYHAPPRTVRRYFDQALGEIDLNAGYYVIREPKAEWITGLAPIVELHYTATLNKSHPVILPSDSNLTSLPGNTPIPGIESNPMVGSPVKYRNILDMTVGTTFEFGNRATLSTAVALPLLGGANRTFDWEVLVQLNFYFGCRSCPSPTPTRHGDCDPYSPNAENAFTPDPPSSAPNAFSIPRF